MKRALAAAALATLAGCGSAAQPRAAAPLTPAPASSSPASPVPSVLPSRPNPCATAPKPKAELVGIGPAGIRWTRVLQEAGDQGGAAQPVVVDGIAYAAVGKHAFAVRDSDGTELWDVPVRGGAYTSYVSGSRFVFEDDFQHLTALDTATGKVAWTLSTPANILGTPPLTGTDGVALGMGKGFTEVVNLSDGSVRWQAKSVGQDQAVADADTVMRVDGSFLLGYDAATGRKLWQVPLQEGDTPVASEGVVAGFDQATQSLQAYDTRTGKRLWSAGRLFPVRGVAGTLLTSEGVDHIDLLDLHTGQTRWRVDGQLRTGSPHPETASDGTVIAYVDDATPHRAIGLSLATGKQVWSNPEPLNGADGNDSEQQQAEFLASVADGKGGGLVTDYTTRTGAVAWQVHLDEQPQGVAQADGDNAVVLTHTQACAVPA